MKDYKHGGAVTGRAFVKLAVLQLLGRGLVRSGWMHTNSRAFDVPGMDSTIACSWMHVLMHQALTGLKGIMETKCR